jgi:plastocyanin
VVDAASITAGDFYYAPNRVTLRVGGTVDWVAVESSHNVIFTPAPGVPENCPEASGTICSRVFGTVGTFAYRCTLPDHDMSGDITVVP